MPGIIITLGGNATPFTRELAKAEAAALAFTTNTQRKMAEASRVAESSQLAGAAKIGAMWKSVAAEVQAASMVMGKSQSGSIASLKREVDVIRGNGMMSGEDSAAKEESLRAIEVEEAARRNEARRLLRERAEARAGAPMQGPDLDGVQRQESAVEKARRDIRARALLRERAEARAGAPMQGPDLDGVQRQEAAVEKARRDIRARALLRERAEARAARTLAAAEEVAATKASQLAQLSVIARGHGAGVPQIGHVRGGNTGGVVAEAATIGHEFLQGRGGGRIIGSISILGQRLGWLRKIVKTTADESVDAAEASKKLGMAMASEAIEAEKLAAKKIADGMASGLDRAASEKLAAAEIKDAASTTAATLAHEKNTAALVEEAAVKRANASITSVLGVQSKVMGGLLVGIVVSLVACIYYYNRLRVVAREAAAAMASVPTFSQQIDAFEKGADEARKMANELAHLAQKQETLATKSDEAVDALHRHAQAVNELNDAVKSAAMSQVELHESTGAITSGEAVQMRAEIEREAITKKAADKQKALDDEAEQRSVDATAAKIAETKAIKDWQTSQNNLTGGKLSPEQQRKVSDVIAMEADNANPLSKDKHDQGLLDSYHAGFTSDEKTAYDAQTRQAKLEAVKASEDELKKKLADAVAARDARNNSMWKRGADNSSHTGWLGTEQSVQEAQSALKAKSAEKEKLLDSMSPEEIAASDAKAKADQAHASAVKLATDATKAATASKENAAVAPSVVALQLTEVNAKEIEGKNRAAKELADAKQQADLAELDLQERTGKISKADALKKRSKMEKDAAQREHPDMVAAPDNVLGQKFREIDAKSKAEQLGQIKGPQNLTAMQKIGAFTAQGGNPLIPLHQRTNSLLQQLVAQSKQSVQLQQPTMGGVHH